MLDYQNPALPIECRVTDLLRRMTLEEKAAQTCMLRGVEYAAKPSEKHNCSVERGRFRILIGAASNDIRLEGDVVL